MSDLVYLYGFVHRAASAPPAELKGIAGRAVQLLGLDAVQAAVSSVPERDFSPEQTQERFNDLEWIGEQGALHERVVTWFVDHGGILPARLLTLYSGPETLRATVGGQAAQLAGLLEAFRDLREWDLKVSYRAQTLQAHLGALSEEVAALDRELAEAPPGRGYLLERKRAQLVKQETSRAARRLANELHEAVAARATDARRLPLPREKADLPVVLSAAYLVRRAAEGDVRTFVAREAERLAVPGLEVRFAGPWAPYRFIGEDEGEPTEEPQVDED